MKDYPTNLTETQWSIIEKELDPKSRKRKHNLKEIVNALLYITVTGCQWRMIPHGFAPWQTVYFYFRKWKHEGHIESIMDYLRECVRESVGRDREASLGIIDSKSVSTTCHVDTERGIDGNKKIKGRKQSIAVDILGLPLAIIITAANIHDSKIAKDLIREALYKSGRLRKFLADGGYRGDDLAKGIKDEYGVDLEIVLRPDECPSKFQVIPKRWVVERSFGWLDFARRVATDFEFHVSSSVAFVQLAFIRIMLNRLSK